MQIAYDDRIAAEYRHVLARPRFGFHPEAVAHLLDYLFTEGLPLVARPLPASLLLRPATAKAPKASP
ncbi:MAG: hypothetical protein JXM73_22975 [Anaerolineae bacterium]|nr:hypothetical protein [Anaerolineae bacterium]